MNKTETGKLGEDLATDFLSQQGYAILERNFRYKKSEIDIICTKDNTLIFVEVKLRKSDFFGNPEEAVNSKKENQILAGATHYIETVNWQKDIRFDIISVIKNSKETKFYHIEDAFH